MGEVVNVQAQNDIEEVISLSKEIVENYKSYKGVYQRYIDAKRRGNLNRLKEKEKKCGEKYEQFIEKTKDIINRYGFSEDVVRAFIEPSGVAEAIASTITFKPTQLRKIFHQIKSIKQEVKGEADLGSNEISLIKLLPLLAYSKGRGLISEDFFELSKTLIAKVRESKKREDFNKFVDIFEAIVAYHKYYNPKEN
ncbi:MAG TPA: type III-A CRISPR-associated protein Csm2 [Persephonella sp.]|nr:type III-A CRISPR-associated protein Csm2 [Persephonella sp.]